MRVLLFVLVMLCALVVTAEARCLRCGTGLVCEGDSRMSAITKCGEPDYSEESTTKTRAVATSGGMDFVSVKAEKLYYNCGQGRFIKILTILNGKINSIENGDRGSGPVKCD